jgi:hypothetical protein
MSYEDSSRTYQFLPDSEFDNFSKTIKATDDIRKINYQQSSRHSKSLKRDHFGDLLTDAHDLELANQPVP